MVDTGQASLRGGTPRHDSPRIHVAQAPTAQAALGDFAVVVQGGTDSQGRAFVNAATSTFYAAESDDIAAALVSGMRQASYSVAMAAGPGEASAVVGATGAVIADGVVYIAQIMPTQVYFLRNGSINALPNERDLDAVDESELDVEQEIDLFRARLEDGDCLVLASTDIRHELTEREIRGMLRRRTAQESAYDMCALIAQRGGQRCEVLVVQFTDISARGVSAVGSAPRATGDMAPTDSLVNEDSAPVHQSGPAIGPAADDFRPLGRAEPSVGRRLDQPGPHGFDDQAEIARNRARSAPRRTLAQRILALPVTLITLIVVLPMVGVRALADLVSGRGRRARTRPEPADSQPPSDQLDDDWGSLRDLRTAGPRAQQPLGGTAPPARPLEYVGADLQGHRDPLLVRRRRSFPGPGTLLFALSLALLVVMAVVLILRNSPAPADSTLVETPAPDGPATTATVTPGGFQPIPSSSRATELLTQAEDLFREAQDRGPAEGRAATLLMLRDAEDLANQALAADTARLLVQDINRLLDDITREEERINRVYKIVPSSTIDEFDSAGIGGAVEALDVRLDSKYVIDAISDQLLSYETARQGISLLRKGDVVGSVTVQDLIAVIDRSLSPIVIDNRYNIFSIDESDTARLLRITGTEEWRTPVAFDNFNNNLYVLDPGANTIFKYQWTAGGYELGPTSYLDARDEIDISRAIDFAIDGDIFVLFEDGSILRFRGGSEIDFTIAGLEGDALRASRIFTDPESESLYLADVANKRIVEIDKREGTAGAFVRQFKYAGSDDFFGDIRGLWVSEIDGRLIVLGKDKLRQFVLPRLADGAAA